MRMAVLALGGRPNFAAERVHHELQPIANAEHRQPELKHPLVGQRRVFVIHRRRPARQNNSYRRIAADFFQAGVKGKYHRENFEFTDAARD